MELLQLKYFKTVAKTGKIAAAAQELFLSAPALSTSIARLEKELGMPLFERTGNRVMLNRQGELFLRYVNQLFGVLEEAKGELRRSLLQEQQHIWVMTTNSQPWIGLITAFSQTYPHFTLSCTNMNLNKLAMENALSQYTFLLAEDQDIPSVYADALESVLLFEDTPAILINPGHPLAKEATVRVEQLAGETLFLPMQGMSSRERFVKLLESGGVETKTATSCSSVVYCNLVRQGSGIAFTTVRAAEMEPADICCVPLENTLPWRMRLYWHKNKPLTEEEQTFKTFVEEYYRITSVN